MLSMLFNIHLNVFRFSMISNVMLAMIHLRLLQLRPDSKRPFGDFNVLFCGDLLQVGLEMAALN